jgi:hypothetical protein
MPQVSNKDILKELKDINELLKQYGHDIGELKEWKIAVEAAKQALKEYQREEDAKPHVTKEGINGKAWAALVTVIGILGAVILAMNNS